MIKDDAGYFAYAPELPGCYSQGKSYEDAVQNIKEAERRLLDATCHDQELTARPHNRNMIAPGGGSLPLASEVALRATLFRYPLGQSP